MKHLVFLLIFVPYFAHSQQVERWEYCTISTILGGFNSKSTFYIDTGEKVTGSFKKPEILKDSTGSEEFKTPVSALNFMGASGWELIDMHISKSPGVANDVQVFTLKRKAVK